MKSKATIPFRKWYRENTGYYLYILPCGKLSKRKMPVKKEGGGK